MSGLEPPTSERATRIALPAGSDAHAATAGEVGETYIALLGRRFDGFTLPALAASSAGSLGRRRGGGVARQLPPRCAAPYPTLTRNVSPLSFAGMKAFAVAVANVEFE